MANLLEIGVLLKKRLIRAVDEFQTHLKAWADFTEKQSDHAPQWKKMVDDYEAKKSDLNPYALPIDGMLVFAFVKGFYKS
jgi:hypothetical protein